MDYLLNNLSLVIGVVSALAGVIGWGIGRIRRSYGFERDINHLKRDYQGLSENVNTLMTEYERRMDAMEKKIEVVAEINKLFVGERYQS